MRSKSRVDLPIAVATAMFRLSDQETYVPIAAKLSSSALNWPGERGRHEAAFVLPLKCARIQRAKQWRNCATRFKSPGCAALPAGYAIESSLPGRRGVAPGKYQLKFLARENESGRIGNV